MKTSSHFRTGKLASALLLSVLFTGVSYSQKPGKKETISYINEKLGSSGSIDVKGGNIIAEFMDASGKKVRQDKVAAFLLDTVIKYEPEEKMLYISCIKGEKECVTRTLYKQGIKRGYGRMSFVVEDMQTMESLKKSLLHLIRIESQIRYNDEISFE